jgi:hypothetical protein
VVAALVLGLVLLRPALAARLVDPVVAADPLGLPRSLLAIDDT